MYILGINSVYHESSACLLKDGAIIAAVEEERFTRKKHAKSARVDNTDELPMSAIYYCLDKAGIELAEVDRIGFSFNPRKRLRNKEFKDTVDENSWGSVSGEDEAFVRLNRVPEKLREKGFSGEFKWIDHHLCHAASGFYPSPFDEAAVLTVDGIGEVSSTSFAHGKKNKLKIIGEILYPASLGFLWEKIAKYLGFTEYDSCKTMGLAGYGDPETYLKHFYEMVRIVPEGRFELDNNILRFRAEDFSGLERLFGVRRRERDQELTQAHKDIAASLQEVTNGVMMHMVNYIHEQTGSENLCMAGGVALNCVSNRLLHEQGPFANLYIQPAAHDAGTAIGAAMVVWNFILGNDYRETMTHAYFGPSFTDEEIETALKNRRVNYQRVEDIERKVAQLLSQMHIVGWFQGAMEVGPRALGNRSLLADPRFPQMREIMNKKIKHREMFQPFAPSVLYEQADKWFEITKPTQASDFMLITYPTKNGADGRIPAVTHIDQTCRIQTVRKETNSKYHKLISEFFSLTGVPLVLNTSFNDSEPIVCSPADAVNTFLKTGMDYLAIGNFLVGRTR